MELPTCPKALIPCRSKQPQKKYNKNYSSSSRAILFFLCFCHLLSVDAQAQEQPSDSLLGWSQNRKMSVLVNQSSFSNWLPGGISNFSGTLNYATLCTKAKNGPGQPMSLVPGMPKHSENAFKNGGSVEVQSQFARNQARMGCTFSFNLKTLPCGLEEKQDQDQQALTRISGFFSPAYLRLGAGFRHQKSEKFQIEINPIMARLIIVDKAFTQNLPADATYFGVAAGQTVRWEAGGAVNMQSKLTLAENITWANRNCSVIFWKRPRM